MMRKVLLGFTLFLALATMISAQPIEHATFDSAGKLTSLIHDGRALPMRAEIVVRFEDGPVVRVQPHDQRSPIQRDAPVLVWRGTREFPNGRSASFSVAWSVDDAGLASVRATVEPGAGRPMEVQAVDYEIDVPYGEFVGGVLNPGRVALTGRKTAERFLFDEEAAALSFRDGDGNWSLDVALDTARRVTVSDHWGDDGHFYRIRVRLHEGLWRAGERFELGASFQLTGEASAAPARLSIDPETRLASFDGFGGNYCWGHESPVTNYTLENLHSAWTRHELKTFLWDRERDRPGPELIDEFERIRRIHDRGIPFIVSAWRFPEKYYVDPHQKRPGTHGRKIAPDRWGELLDLIGSYLLHLKNNYGAEAAMFSFNEPDLGVDVKFSPEEHRDAIKRIGAHLESLGLKTKMLLGDTANPRDRHKYVLPTAMDPDAMRYVAGVSFHSWGGATPAQYEAWAEVAAWLQLPLFVGEAGVDPGAWRNRAYDSYAYGLREAAQMQDILRYARPAVSLYWEFSDDYRLVDYDESGNVTPTGRFWLMKHFANLTPRHSSIVASASDQPDVLVSAFAGADTEVVHILNAGPAREAAIEGLPAGRWREVITTEAEGFSDGVIEIDQAQPAPVPLRARSLTTLIRKAAR